MSACVITSYGLKKRRISVAFKNRYASIFIEYVNIPAKTNV